MDKIFIWKVRIKSKEINAMTTENTNHLYGNSNGRNFKKFAITTSTPTF